MRGSTFGSLVLVVIGLLIVACSSLSIDSEAVTPEIYREPLFSYRGMSTEQVIDDAEAILIGQVISISPSRWNQDNGEYWEDETSQMASLQYYEVTLEVAEAVVDRIGLGDKPVITVLGPGLARTDSEAEARDIQHTQTDNISFYTGEKVLLFLKRVPLAWRGGPIEKIMLVGGPQGKYTLTDDGRALNTSASGKDTTLSALLEQISARRNTTP